MPCGALPKEISGSGGGASKNTVNRMGEGSCSAAGDSTHIDQQTLIATAAIIREALLKRLHTEYPLCQDLGDRH